MTMIQTGRTMIMPHHGMVAVQPWTQHLGVEEQQMTKQHILSVKHRTSRVHRLTHLFTKKTHPECGIVDHFGPLETKRDH